MALRDDILAAARSRSDLTYRLDPPPDGRVTTDCSLLVVDSARDAGAALPPGVRTAEQIRQASTLIDWADVKPADLLFFEGTYDAGPVSADGHIASHIGFSLGAGTHRMLDAHERDGADVAETDISTAYWQDHLFEARRLPALATPVVNPPTAVDPWQFFSADQITRASGANLDHVLLYWPKLVAQLVLAGINDRWTQIAVLATIAVEVGSRFEPIHEYGTPADWASYSGGAAYAGRGFVQLTHDYNYRTYSQKVNDLWQAGGAIDLVARPDDALDPDVASAVMALYFKDHGIPAMAAAENWAGVRQAVNGGMAGWQTFADAVEALKKIPGPVVPPPVPVPAAPITKADIDALIATLTDWRDRVPA